MNFLKKMFGKKSGDAEIFDLIEGTLEGLIEKADLDLAYDISENDDDGIDVELYGEDEEMLKEKEGQLLDAFQFFTKRVIQHQMPETRVRLYFDSNGFRDEANQALVDLAERLKTMALEKKKSVYCKALPPKDRRIIHQHLADDDQVKTRSIGDGHYKKIKIFPAQGGDGGGRDRNQRRGNQRKGGQSSQQRDNR